MSIDTDKHTSTEEYIQQIVWSVEVSLREDNTMDGYRYLGIIRSTIRDLLADADVTDDDKVDVLTLLEDIVLAHRARAGLPVIVPAVTVGEVAPPTVTATVAPVSRAQVTVTTEPRVAIAKKAMNNYSVKINTPVAPADVAAELNPSLQAKKKPTLAGPITHTATGRKPMSAEARVRIGEARRATVEAKRREAMSPPSIGRRHAPAEEPQPQPQPHDA